jgi:hypothetical protein
MFGAVVGSASADDCQMCEAGKVSPPGSSSCADSYAATASHAWDFRGCDASAPVLDSSGGALKATLMNGAECGADGVAFDGVDDYVDLDDWEWGGALTIEAYVKYESFNMHSRVLDFSNGAWSDNVILANDAASSTIGCSVFPWSSEIKVYTVLGGSWDQSAWTHVVATVSGATMKVYKNGELAATKHDGREPQALTRAQHWLGRSAWESDGFLHGTIAYVRVWHGAALGQGEVAALYPARDGGGA